METTLPNGVWPTMITPFTQQGELDFPSLNRLVDWYIDQGVTGLFAVCQSSEMFYLTLEEKVALASATVAAANGRVPVICSGHTSDEADAQVEELLAMSETGVRSVVLITNRFAHEDEGDDVFLQNLGYVLDRLPTHIPLGFYECPYPYKRLVSDTVLRFAMDTGRFSFLKDTCCDSALMHRRLKIMGTSGFKLFNANSATLSLSLTFGASGYSGVMANFHPDRYVALVDSQLQVPGSGDALQNVLGPLSALEDVWYPMTAKYHLATLGIISSTFTRKHGSDELPEASKLIVDQMRELWCQTPIFS